MLICCLETPDIFLRGGPPCTIHETSQKCLLGRKSSSCFSCRSQTFPDRCIFIWQNFVHVHLGRYLPPYLQEHPFLKKNNRFAFGYSLSPRFQNKFAITILSHLRFYFRYYLFDNSKTIKLSMRFGRKINGMKWNEKILASHRISDVRYKLSDVRIKINAQEFKILLLVKCIFPFF